MIENPAFRPFPVRAINEWAFGTHLRARRSRPIGYAYVWQEGHTPVVDLQGSRRPSASGRIYRTLSRNACVFLCMMRIRYWQMIDARISSRRIATKNAKHDIEYASRCFECSCVFKQQCRKMPIYSAFCSIIDRVNLTLRDALSTSNKITRYEFAFAFTRAT